MVGVREKVVSNKQHHSPVTRSRSLSCQDFLIDIEAPNFLRKKMKHFSGYVSMLLLIRQKI